VKPVVQQNLTAAFVRIATMGQATRDGESGSGTSAASVELEVRSRVQDGSVDLVHVALLMLLGGFSSLLPVRSSVSISVRMAYVRPRPSCATAFRSCDSRWDKSKRDMGLFDQIAPASVARAAALHCLALSSAR
jgi:hypothetical protein